MNTDNYAEWFDDKLQELTGVDYIKEWFMPEDLEAYIRERSYHKSDWDDPTDWVNGMSLGIAFHYREYLKDNNAEAKFRIQLAMYLISLIRRIELNED